MSTDPRGADADTAVVRLVSTGGPARAPARLIAVIADIADIAAATYLRAVVGAL